MPYVVVDNFSAGLDSRRHVLNSKSGTLSVLNNAHVTRGGEIEKRKAFVPFANLPIGNTFGMEATADTIYVFGDDPGVGPGVMPAGVTYQLLQHPVNPGAYMTRVVYSTVYGGKPFVIAEFGNLTAPHTIAFYDGVAVKDWYEGVVFGTGNVLTDLASYLNAGGYSTAAVESGLSGYPDRLVITGQPGKTFTASSIVPSVLTATVATVQESKAAIPETLSSASFKITGGSTTAASAYRGTRYLDAASLPGIRSIRIGASSPTTADGLDLIGWSGTNGLKYNTVSPTETTGSPGGSLYWNIRKAINDNTTSGIGHGYSARWRWGGNWSGNDPNDLWIDAPAYQGSQANGVLVQIEFDGNPANVARLYEFIDTSTIAVSPYNNQRHIATFGYFSGGSFNRINSVKVDGVEVLGTPVSWDVSHGATAAAVVAQINAYTSETEYSASVTDGSKVVLTGAAGSGKAPNGKVIEIATEGTVVISSVTPFIGGKDFIPALPQITHITYSPSNLLAQYNLTFKDKYSVAIIEADNPTVPKIFGASRVGGKDAAFSVTYKAKEYVGSGSTIFFSAVNDATKWDIYDTGSGFIDMSNNFGGRENLTGAGVYQDKLAVFSRRNVQLWFMDADPAQNQQLQVLANTGAIAPDSIVSVGSVDLMYLADNGVRSLRARENTDTAYANDIGSAIDSIIIAHMASVGDAKYKAKAIIEPVDGRYWLAIDDKIYVLSYFQGSNIAAWSMYEPGFTVVEMVAKEDKVYVRGSNDVIYVYGGTDGTTYDDCEVVVEMPYIDGNKPATYKEAKGVDLTCNGEWEVRIGFDHTNPTARDLVATVNQSTFALGKIPATGAGTHFGPRFVNQSAGPALLANFIIHYDEMHSKHDAG